MRFASGWSGCWTSWGEPRRGRSPDPGDRGEGLASGPARRLFGVGLGGGGGGFLLFGDALTGEEGGEGEDGAEDADAVPDVEGFAEDEDADADAGGEEGKHPVEGVVAGTIAAVEPEEADVGDGGADAADDHAGGVTTEEIAGVFGGTEEGDDADDSGGDEEETEDEAEGRVAGIGSAVSVGEDSVSDGGDEGGGDGSEEDLHVFRCTCGLEMRNPSTARPWRG